MEYTPEELEYAARAAHKTSGKRNLARVIGKASAKSCKSLRKVMTSEKPSTPYTPKKALALMISLDLTKHQYVSMQQEAM